MAENWNDNRIILLIEEYKKHKCLWSHTDFHNKSPMMKNDAWLEIAAALETNVHEVKRKMASLLASFRRERRKGRASHWYAFNHLSFLLEKFSSTSASKGLEEEDATEWWAEHNSITDDPELVNMQELDDKLEFQNDSKSNLATDLIPVCTEIYENTYAGSKKISLNPRKKPRYERSIEYANYEDSEETTVKPKSVTELFIAYLAAKLATYTKYERNIVQHKINDILFQADMGNFAKTPSEEN